MTGTTTGATTNFEIRFSGTGGQGLQLSARILAEALNLEGKWVARSQSYEPTSRGGISRSDLVVGSGPVDYPLITKLDYLIVLDQSAVSVSLGLLGRRSVVLADAMRVPEPPKGRFKRHVLRLVETARGLGNERVANIVALGALIGLAEICAYDSLVKAIRDGAPAKLLDLNLEAVAAGHEMTAPARAAAAK